MNRRQFAVTSLSAGAGVGLLGCKPAAEKKAAAPAPLIVSDPLVAKVAKAALAMQRYSWEQGVLAQAFLEAGDDETVIAMARAALIYKTPDGRLAAIGGGITDAAMGGEAYWRAGQLTGDPLLKDAAQGLLDFLLKRAPRAPDGTFYHPIQGAEIWSDSYYTSPPFLASTGNYDEALRQIDGFRKRLWSPEKKLLSHKWDEKKQAFIRKDFWGVGNGWATAGITRVIHALPPERGEDRTRMAAFVKDILDGCLAYQRPDALFHDVLDKPGTFVETNLAQILAYTIYTGVAGGWLPATYMQAADRMRAAARAKVDRYGLVQDVCGAPDFDRAGIAPEGQAFFIRMEAAANVHAPYRKSGQAS
jgi:unsaturated rhamnogalacturonyl hydrolase